MNNIEKKFLNQYFILRSSDNLYTVDKFETNDNYFQIAIFVNYNATNESVDIFAEKKFLNEPSLKYKIDDFGWKIPCKMNF